MSAPHTTMIEQDDLDHSDNVAARSTLVQLHRVDPNTLLGDRTIHTQPSMAPPANPPREYTRIHSRPITLLSKVLMSERNIIHVGPSAYPYSILSLGSQASPTSSMRIGSEEAACHHHTFKGLINLFDQIINQ